MNRPEGAACANCADLPAFVIDKYFDCNVNLQPLHALAAQAICGNCVVLEQCREEALHMANPPSRGIIGGINATQLKAARAWRSYEQGIRDAPPSSKRPTWLAMTDAAQIVEQARLEADPDEPPVER